MSILRIPQVDDFRHFMVGEKCAEAGEMLASLAREHRPCLPDPK